MRLKQLEVVGLKSFANKTTLDFHSGVTAIVGPNGCGKSNVVDAIRWVLGEQSAKHLRGDSMEDVIFKGNGRLGPAGMAEVALTFENVEPAAEIEADLDVSSLPEHFRNLSEITVSRRYFRSGESEYAINRTPCRLRDITELFLGTGIGSKAYAIIEQGRVEQLINAKPEDRRLFIEEAGGTTLYRSRRLSAERKIERTRENLARVTDVAREIERQIQYLNRLAKKAERYRVLRDESREAELRLGRHRWGVLRDRIEAASAAQGQFRDEEERLRAQVAQLEERRDACVAAQRAAEERLASLRESAAATASERDSAAERVVFLRNELQERERREARLVATRDGIRARCEQIATELAAAREQVAVLSESLEADRGRVADEEDRLGEARRAVVAARAETESAKARLLSVVSAESDARNELARFERLQHDAELRRGKADADCCHLGEQLSAAEHCVAGREAVQANLRARLDDARQAREGIARALAAVAADLAKAQQAARDRQERSLRCASTAASLRQIHEAYEGYSPVVRDFMLERDRWAEVVAVVGDVLQVPAEFEPALAGVLGARIHCLVVGEVSEGAEAVRRLRERRAGRGSFVAQRAAARPRAQLAAPTGPGGTSIRPLLDVVAVEEPFRTVAEALLGGVYLVADLDAALALAPESEPGTILVTPEGDVVDSSGVVTGGSEDASQQELVSRRRRLEEASRQSSDAAAAAALAAQDVEQLAAFHAERSAELAGQDQALRRLTEALTAADRDLAKLRVDVPRLRDRLRLTRFERQAARRDARSAVEKAEGVVGRLAELDQRRRQADIVLKEATAGLQSNESVIEELMARLRESSAALVDRQQRVTAAETAVARLGAESAALVARLDGIGEELVEVASEKGAIERSIEECSGVADERRGAAEDLARGVIEAREALARAGAAVEECASGWDAARSRLEGVREQLAKAELAMAEDRMRREHLEADIAERFAVALGEGAPEGEACEPLAPLEPDAEEELAERVKELRANLARMGEVDTGSIEQLRELQEREESLRTQREDLERSIADLERTIQKLNRVSRTRFAETFAAVNEKFQVIVPRLLRGGEARLVLTDENNLLETGVEIFVRPPGKRLDSITLMSGGEKALIAVSLIFSLFLINPTPFCFLDEVDAPLDDANIGRFSGLVKEMSQHSQFIVITHNKRTMEAAHALYGVTMEEPGISKIVSVSPVAPSA